MVRPFIESSSSAILRWRQRLLRTLIHTGRHDLVLSVGMTTALLIPLLAKPVAAQVGVSEAGQVLCSGSFNIAQILTVGLGLLSMYFIFKGLIRMMQGLDNAGATTLSVPEIEDEVYDTPQEYGHQQARGGIYSIAAALLPSIVPAFLAVAGIDVIACLFP
ncbi:hypothetical protein [Halocatena marina]|uniref:hypothetical protein n=1 Tax=Halocatena marina TaxID=2934937 RepID=UPI00200F9348|nr:hypothetical protein [Halocatena marina]